MQEFETGLRIVVVLMILGSFFVAFKFRTQIRWVLIGAADYLVVLASLLLVIIFGAVCSYYFEYFGWNYDYRGLGVVGFLVGGAAGFIVASLLASVFLSLTETARNTRRMLAYYEPQPAEPQRQYADEPYHENNGQR